MLTKNYYGSTSDRKARFSVHNAGGNVSTKPFRSWELAWYGGFANKQTAIEFEKYLIPENIFYQVLASVSRGYP